MVRSFLRRLVNAAIEEVELAQYDGSSAEPEVHSWYHHALVKARTALADPPAGTGRALVRARQPAPETLVPASPMAGIEVRREPWQRGQREVALAALEPLHTPQRIGRSTNNFAYLVESHGARRAVSKPRSGERDPGSRPIDVGTFMNREVGVYRVDQRIGFRLVPVTTPWEHPGRGPASLQDWLPDEGLGVDAYDPLDAEWVGVLHYITAQTDAYTGNHRTQADSRPGVHDNGFGLPRDNTYPIISAWTVGILNRPLHPRTLAMLRGADLPLILGDLDQLHIEPSALRGFHDRFQEARSGVIRGTAWGGEFKAW